MPNFDFLCSTCQQVQCKSAGAKAALKKIMKLVPVVKFINILRAAFAPIFFHQKIIKPNGN